MTHKFVVSCTSHMIDYIGLDSTSLHIIEASTPRKAVKQVIMELKLEEDECYYDDIKRGNEDLPRGMSQEDFDKLTKEEFLQKRKEYWSKKGRISLRKNEESCYPFYFDDQDRSSMVYGFKCLELK